MPFLVYICGRMSNIWTFAKIPILKIYYSTNKSQLLNSDRDVAVMSTVLLLVVATLVSSSLRDLHRHTSDACNGFKSKKPGESYG